MNIQEKLLVGIVFVALCAPGALHASPASVAALERDDQGTGNPDAMNPVPAGGPSSGPAEDAGAVENPFRDLPLESLSATTERPLFSPTRRPPPAAAAPAQDPSPPPAQAPAPVASQPDGPPLTLIGTVLGAGHPVAVLFNKLTRSVSTAHEGDEALGWQITTVSARSATAEKDGVSVTLNLPRPGDPTPSDQ